MGLAIGVDIGGTKVAAGVVDDEGHVLARLRRDTPAQDPEKVEDVIAEAIRELAADHEVEAAGLGAAGFVDAARSTVLFAPNLPWRNQPLRAAVEQRTGLPVVVENDANAAAWAETRFGAGAAAGSSTPAAGPWSPRPASGPRPPPRRPGCCWSWPRGRPGRSPGQS
jgi:glucokinase